MSRAARVGLAVAIAGWLLIGLAAWRLWPVIRQFTDPARPKTFYIPAESMLPTLQVLDRVRPRIATPEQLRQGAVIVFAGPADVRVSRIVAVAGDVVRVEAGMLSINNRVGVRDVGTGPFIEGVPSRVKAERLPGEPREHLLLDLGSSILDDYGPVRVPSGHLFVMGDNRDRSADSRLSAQERGVGFVPTDAVIGIVDRLLWARGFRKLGLQIDAGPRT